jgi:hypothetical protein
MTLPFWLEGTMSDDYEDYEIRFLNSAGGVSLVHVTLCASDGHAHEAALRLFNHSFHSYEIWRGTECIKRGGHPMPETRGDKTSAKT